MRVCILCEESKVSQVREKMKRPNILTIKVSPSGEMPATHHFCCVTTDEKGAQDLLGKREITTMEVAEPKEFLSRMDLKIIKE